MESAYNTERVYEQVAQLCEQTMFIASKSGNRKGQWKN